MIWHLIVDIACCIFHAPVKGFVPLARYTMVSLKNKKYDHLFRAEEAYWNVKGKFWKIATRDETQINPNQTYYKTSDLIPTIDYNWMTNGGKFWRLPEQISQCDGPTIRDEMSSEENAGVKLGKLTCNLEQNAEEIQAICETIEEEGINTYGIRKNSRFNASGLATQASENK